MAVDISVIVHNYRDGATAVSASVAALAEQVAHSAPGALLDTMLACVRAQPAMAPVARVASAVLLAFEAEGEPGVARAVGAFLAERAAAHRLLVEAAGQQIGAGAHVLTHSASSAVRDALLAAHTHGIPFQVTCLEARPLGEGRELASALAAAGVRVRLMVDAAMGLAAGEADVVLVGADTVAGGLLIHKAGTWPLCLAAGELGVACFVLATEDKLLPWPTRGALEKVLPGDQVVTGGLAGVTLANRAFDATPLDLLEGCFVGGELLTLEQVEERAGQITLHPAVLAELDDDE